MRKQYDILVLSDPASKAKQKWPQRPSKRTKYQARRLNNPLITFYDLGQVNNQDLNDAPVWEDHPILKTPSFTVEPFRFNNNVSNPLSQFNYRIEPFLDADFQAYTDLMFTYPVEDWNRRYRKIEAPDLLSDEYTSDIRISLRDMETTEEVFLPANGLDHDAYDAATYRTNKANALSTNRWAYDRDRQGAIYRGLDELAVNITPESLFTGFVNGSFFDGVIDGGYFGFSTGDKDTYKVTTTYDPDAPDAGVIVPHGNIEVYLMPQIGFWAAVSNTSDFTSSEVLGICYQIMPRINWPRYVDPSGTSSDIDAYGSDSTVADYLTYQIGRSGMQYSSWEFLGYDGTGPANPLLYNVNTGVPSDWTGLDMWGLSVMGSTDVPFNFRNGPSAYYLESARGGQSPSTLVTSHSTSFFPDDDISAEIIRNSTTFLVAVFKMGGRFYYVWDIAGNSVTQTLHQGGRFRLSRGIDWDAAHIDTVPPRPRDGTKDFLTY